jgi:hypothetical protein
MLMPGSVPKAATPTSIAEERDAAPAQAEAAVDAGRMLPPRANRLLTAVPDLVAPAVAGFSVPAMVLLLLDFFVIPLALALGVAGAVAAVLVTLSGGPDRGTEEAPNQRHEVLWTVLALVLAGGFFLANARYSAQNLYVTRDPGTYTVTAEWLTHSRGVLVPTGSDVFGTVPGLDPESAGFRLDPHDSDRVYPQGNHLLPAVLALGGWVAGPEVLLRINALVGALALLAVFGLARRFIGGMFALAAVAALGLSMPMLQFSRDNYTEPLTLLLLFGGFSLLWRAMQTRRRSQFFVAGVTMGSTAMARIDAYAALLAVIVAAVAMLAAAPAGDRRGWLARVGWLAVGTMATAWLGFVDVTQLSSGYYADTRKFIVPLLYAAVGLTVAGAVVVALAWRTPSLGRLFAPRWRGWWATGAAVLVVAAFAVLASRPLWMKDEGRCDALIGGLQTSMGLPYEPCRTYGEQTVSWFAWYYGWPIYTLAVLGLALLAYRIIRRGELLPLAPVGAVVGLSLMYFVGPNIYPDQVWAMRRYLPVVIPGLLVSAGYLLHLLWVRRNVGSVHRVGGYLAIGFAALLVAWPAVVTHPMWAVRTGVPQLAQVEAVCDRIGDDAAVVALGTSAIGSYTQTMRSFCKVPSQAMADPSPAQLAEVRANVEAAGRTLYVIAEQPQFVPYEPGLPADPGSFFTAAVAKWPERLETVPNGAHRYLVPLYLGEVNADGTVRPVV